MAFPVLWYLCLHGLNLAKLTKDPKFRQEANLYPIGVFRDEKQKSGAQSEKGEMGQMRKMREKRKGKKRRTTGKSVRVWEKSAFASEIQFKAVTRKRIRRGGMVGTNRWALVT